MADVNSLEPIPARLGHIIWHESGEEIVVVMLLLTHWGRDKIAAI